MEYRRLGLTDMEVSVIGLGTMTWGQQNSEAEAHAQLDAALDAGVTLIDTAEMYPIPPRAETQGRTEEYIGSWLAARRNRDKVILATKVTGGSDGFPYLRGGRTRLDRPNITAALEASLRRLRTDYVDLYQLHWPDRTTNYFGALGYTHVADEESVPLEETLAVLADIVAAGKARAVGISNESPWGAMKYLALAERDGLPRMASIQNPYNLLNRTFEIGLAEIAIRENLSLVAYSPLGGGTLTGKYLDGARPPGARMTLWPERYGRYFTPGAEPAVRAYVSLARAHGLDPAQMAIAYVLSRPFLTSVLVGATSMDQLRTDLGALEVKLDEDLLKEIERIHIQSPNPCP